MTPFVPKLAYPLNDLPIPIGKAALYRWERLGLIKLWRVGAKTLLSHETIEDIVAGRIALPEHHSRRNAKAMAAYYTNDAKVFLQGRGDDGITIKEYDGREEIEKLYADLFKDKGTIQSKNTGEYARLLASDVLVIAGTFEPNLDPGDTLKVPFYQVRLKQGDKWMINSLRIFLVGEKK